MIVRDEQDTLGRCLESVAGVFDEIVIVDTGSNDATKDVATRWGARVFDFAWIDDFAAARNFAFAQGSSELLMWLDADDVLLPTDREKLLALKADLDPRIDAVSMVYHTQFDAAGNVTSSNRRFRIVRRDKDVSWAGIVHEDLVFAGQFTYLDTDIVVTHRKPDTDSGPSRRNLTILENHIAAGRQLRPVDVFNYARELKCTSSSTGRSRSISSSSTTRPRICMFARSRCTNRYRATSCPGSRTRSGSARCGP